MQVQRAARRCGACGVGAPEASALSACSRSSPAARRARSRRSAVPWRPIGRHYPRSQVVRQCASAMYTSYPAACSISCGGELVLLGLPCTFVANVGGAMACQKGSLGKPGPVSDSGIVGYQVTACSMPGQHVCAGTAASRTSSVRCTQRKGPLSTCAAAPQGTLRLLRACSSCGSRSCRLVPLLYDLPICNPIV